jgi:DUF1009 family protein
MSQIPKSLLLLAGWGDYPQLVIEGARKAGVEKIVVIGIKGSTQKKVLRAADESYSLGLGDGKGLLNLIQKVDCGAVVLAGQINPLSIFRTRFDSVIRGLIKEVGISNAHTIYGKLSEMLNGYGMEVLPASFFMADHIPAAGILTKQAPTPEQQKDIEYGNDVAMGICNLDVGQTTIVKNGVVVAVEGIDGTNATIKRCKKICGKGAIVVKVAKEDHDMRFDIPVIGTRTIKVMKKAGISVLSIQAGRTIVLNMPKVISKAESAGISIIAVQTSYPSAPVASSNIKS